MTTQPHDADGGHRRRGTHRQMGISLRRGGQCSIVCARGQGQAPAGWQDLTSGSGSSGRWFLHPQDGLLPEQDQDLPLGRHVVSAMELIQIIERLVACMPVGSEEVVVGDPEGNAVVCAIKVVIAAGSPVGCLECAIHSLDDLLEGTELG